MARNILVILGVVILVGVVVWLRSIGCEQPEATMSRSTTLQVPTAAGTEEAEICEPAAGLPPSTQTSAAPARESAPKTVRLPRMVDLGAESCIPCKRMAPILKELKSEFAGRAEITFIDVRKDRSAAVLYQVRAIPTQVFFDREGREVWRHVGFLSKKAIVAKLRELGVR